MTEEKKEQIQGTETTPNEQAKPAPVEKAVNAAPAVKAILARKIGMTRIYNATGRFIPVTVLEAGPCPVLQVKTQNNDGYDALQLAFGSAKAKNIVKPMSGHLAKAQSQPMRWIREFRVAKTDGFQAGQEIRVENFAEGDVVDVSGVNKGKGFAGVVKRHRFRGGPTTHGQSDRTRAPGTSGGQRPQRVFKGIRGPGHMGAEWSTVQRLKVVQVDAEKNLLLVQGSVPGPNGECVSVRQTTRPGRAKKASPVVKAAKKAAPKAAAKAAAKK